MVFPESIESEGEADVLIGARGGTSIPLRFISVPPGSLKLV